MLRSRSAMTLLVAVEVSHERGPSCTGRVQGEQVLRLARGGPVLCVTGPRRSSAAQERLEVLRATVGKEVDLVDTEAGEWTEAAGIMAFGDRYRVFKSRNPALAASVVNPANTGLALELLHRFWTEGRALPLRSFTTPSPYPPP